MEYIKSCWAKIAAYIPAWKILTNRESEQENKDYVLPNVTAKRTVWSSIANLPVLDLGIFRFFSRFWFAKKIEKISPPGKQPQNNDTSFGASIENQINFKTLCQNAQSITDYWDVDIEQNKKNVDDDTNTDFRLNKEIFLNISQDSAITKDDFINLLDKSLHNVSDLCDTRLWVGGNAYVSKELENSDLMHPFVQRICVGAGTRLLLLGDSHGDWKSRVLLLKDEFSDDGIIKDTNTKICVLGDIVDRGLAGAELLYYFLLLRLKNKNNFFLIRGNHEDVEVNKKFGFARELKAKYGEENFDQIQHKIKRIYNTFPVALFIKSGNSALCGCHGFMDSRYNPELLLNNQDSDLFFEKYPIEINRFNICNTTSFTILNEKNQECCANTDAAKKFAQVDFLHSVLQEAPGYFLWIEDQNGIKFDQKTADALRQDWSASSCKLLWVFRAHQHYCGAFGKEDSANSHSMKQLFKGKGVASSFYPEYKREDGKLIPGRYITLQVAPNTIFGKIHGDNYPGFNYDTAVSLIVGNTENSWKIDTIHKQAFKVSLEQIKSFNEGGVEYSTYLDEAGTFVLPSLSNN